MQIKTITYKRIRNLGNYENESLEMSAEIYEFEDQEEVIKQLKAAVYHNLFPHQKDKTDIDYI